MDANLSGFLGVIIGSLIVLVGSFLTNYFQLKRDREQWERTQQLEKEKRDFEISKENHAFIIQVKERRVKQIEEYLYDTTEVLYETMSCFLLAMKAKNQIELDSTVNKFWNGPDVNEKGKFTFYSIINSLGDAELTVILGELDGVSVEITNLFIQLVDKSILFETVIQRGDSLKNEMYMIRDKYRNALTKFYARLDKLYEGWGIIGREK